VTFLLEADPADWRGWRVPTTAGTPVAGKAGVSGSGPTVQGLLSPATQQGIGASGGTPWPADAADGVGDVDGLFRHDASVLLAGVSI